MFKKPVYKFIGIAFDTYIIIEYEKENVYYRPTCCSWENSIWKGKKELL